MVTDFLEVYVFHVCVSLLGSEAIVTNHANIVDFHKLFEAHTHTFTLLSFPNTPHKAAD